MSEVKVIGIGNDHAAVDLKNEIKAYLEEKGYKVVNYGTDSSESCDYPIYGAKVGHAVASGEAVSYTHLTDSLDGCSCDRRSILHRYYSRRI